MTERGSTVHETPTDLEWLQRLLDDSYTRAGAHLTGIHTGPVRITAADLVTRMPGMQVFVVATVSADGRPFTGPVDAFLYRGRVHFGTSPDALRARHLRRSPAVSATHVRGEELVVTVHGRAVAHDPASDSGFATMLRDFYGPGWDAAHTGAPYFRIDPDRMFAADMSVHTQAAAQ